MTKFSRTPGRLGLIAAIVVMFGAISTVPASAHTELVSSTPARNAKVASLTEVRLVFSEHVTRAQVQIRDAHGGTHQTGAATVRDATVTQQVATGLTAGTYTVDYRVVSADGHPVEESLPFAITETAQAGNGPDPSASAGASVKAADGQAAGGEQAAGSSGSANWFTVGAGLLAGIGIGMAMVIFRKRKNGAPGDGH
jgi:methionine-rich copper-binding protein CopC